MAYVAVIERSSNGWSAYVPDLPGCIATGLTRKEAQGNIESCIEVYLRVLREKKLPIPRPSTIAVEIHPPATSKSKSA